MIEILPPNVPVFLKSARYLGLVVYEGGVILPRQSPRDAHLSKRLTPFIGNTPCCLADHLAGVLVGDLEKLASFQRQTDRPVVHATFQYRRFEMRIAVRRGFTSKTGDNRQRPAFT